MIGGWRPKPEAYKRLAGGNTTGPCAKRYAPRQGCGNHGLSFHSPDTFSPTPAGVESVCVANRWCYHRLISFQPCRAGELALAERHPRSRLARRSTSHPHAPAEATV